MSTIGTTDYLQILILFLIIMILSQIYLLITYNWCQRTKTGCSIFYFMCTLYSGINNMTCMYPNKIHKIDILDYLH